eukprot:TRINITY_DN103173_c0_g1_i1.p1 TRINITY_DN103173_c0_g1~~TRINITY_DN103173_c0_g1_i1.p1  ORF type:complete len:672 (+),score=189.61 TRINITY_DN103173_c0_g1_i1:233-2248(+)
MVVHNVRDNEGRALMDVLNEIRRWQGQEGSTNITCRVLAAVDHDGVCSTKIFVTVLERIGVKYSVVPVTGNEEISDNITELGEDQEVRSLVLLNCGAGLDLQPLLDQSEAHADLKCYVIDAHRPVLLSNLSRRHERVVILDDDPTAETVGVPPPVDDTDEEDDEEDFASDAEEDPWDGGGDQGAVAAAQDERKRKREERADRVLLRQEREDRKRQKVGEYYQSTYYATPAAISVFKMSKLFAAASQDLLWIAAVALTGYHELGLLHKMAYEQQAWEELKETLDRSAELAYMSQSTGFEHASQKSGSGGGGDEESGFDSAPFADRPTPARALASSAEPRKLRFETDLRLTLYKHWILEEAMMHSSYFYGAMELHRDKGLRSQKAFFAKSGIQKDDYRQLYTSMQTPVRRQLHDKFRNYGSEFGLDNRDMFLQQFVREHGAREDRNGLHLHEVSAVDCSTIMNAVLSFVPAALSGGRLESLPQTADGRIDSIAVNEMERKAAVDNFWRAYGCVLCREPRPLREGTEEAIEIAKAVQTLARMVKDSKAMHGSRLFRWVKLEQPPHFFRHPINVRKLAVWLHDVLFKYRPKGGEAGDRPLLVIVRDRVRDTYLCVGMTPSKGYDKDEFGDRFRSVIRANPGLRYRYDFFDKSCIEIAADDFDRFWDAMSDGPGHS